MKTYKKQIESPRLVISYDTDAESPRKNCDNLGYFLTKENRYNSPDSDTHDLYDCMLEAESEANDIESHIEAIKRIAKEHYKEGTLDEKILAIYPITRHEHGNVYYSLGTKSGFDNSSCGFYIITDKTAKLPGTPKKSFEKVIKQELEVYTQWANGKVYGFRLYDRNGEEIENCWGFYDIEEMRSYLGKEWKNEKLSNYLK